MPLIPAYRFPPLYAKDINRLITSSHPTGQILFQDDMEGLVADASNRYYQAVGTIARGDDYSLSGLYSLKMTTAAVAGSGAGARIWFGLSNYLTKIGLELKWMSHAQLANFRFIKFGLTYYDGALAHEADVRWYGTYLAPMEEWQRLNAGAGLTSVFDQRMRIPASESCWNSFKMIVDFKANKFDKVISNEKSKSIREPLRDSSAAAIEPCLGIYLELYTETATAINAWIDDLILTDEG